jgi:hypothetical protein
MSSEIKVKIPETNFGLNLVSTIFGACVGVYAGVHLIIPVQLY